MFGTTLHRMILLELVKVFSLSLVSLTGLFLMAGLIQEASRQGLSLLQIAAAIPLFVPSTLPFTIPATTLFATCVVYGRLSHDNEVTAIKAAGINLLTVLKPAVLLGLTTSGVTLFLYTDIIPRTQQLLQAQLISDAEELLYGQLKRSRCFNPPQFPYAIFVKDVQGKRLIDVIVKKRQKLGTPPPGQEVVYWGYDTVARAHEAKLSVDRESKTLSVFMERSRVFGDGGAAADIRNRQQFVMELPKEFLGPDVQNRPTSMTWAEVRRRRGEVGGELDDLRQQLAETRTTRAALEAAGRPAASGAVQEVVIQELNLGTKLRFTERLSLALDAEIQMRPAMALGCLCFVLVGCPVGIWASRADYLSSFVTCFLPTVFVYYPLMLCGTNLGKEGKLPMVPALWMADVVLGTAALVLIARLMRR